MSKYSFGGYSFNTSPVFVFTNFTMISCVFSCTSNFKSEVTSVRKYEKIPKWDPFPGGWVDNPEVLACVNYVRTHPLPPLGEGNKDGLAG